MSHAFRPSSRRLISVLALMVAAAASVPATRADAQIAVRSAGADGRFTTALDPKTTVPGFSSRQVGVFRTNLAELTDRLVAMPEVNTPGAPMCMRVSSFIESQSERGLLEASVDVSRPVLVDGRCTELLGATVQFWLNRTDTLLTSRLARASSPSGEPWYLLPFTREDQAGFAVEDDGDEIEVYTHGRAPLLVPVTWTEYSGGGGADIWTEADYEAWLAGDYRDLLDAARREAATNAAAAPADLRQDIMAAVEAGLQAQAEVMRSMVGRTRGEIENLTGRPLPTPSQDGSGPAVASGGEMTCWIADRAEAGAECAPGERLMRLNPDYFNPASAETVQLVIVRTPKQPQSEDGAAYAERRAIWNALDRPALGRMSR